MPLRKMQRVEFKSVKGIGYGVVWKTGKKTVVVTDDDKQVSGPEGAFRPSNQPLPAGHFSFVKHEKGDRVEFDQDGTTYYGVVEKGGSISVTVVIDGGQQQSTARAAYFRKSTRPLPTMAPDAMDCWSLKSYKEHAKLSEETPCFEATICLDGKPVIFASNDGHGGCNMYRPLQAGSHDLIARLESDAKSWSARFGGEDAFELADSWLSWEATGKKHGVTAKAYWDEVNSFSAEFKSGI